MKIETFTEADLPLVHELQPEGWGPIVPGFEFFTRASYCDPVKVTLEGNMIAVGSSIRNGDSAWLASIIVRPEHRNKGIGQWITQSLIDKLNRKKYQTIYLDATEFGYPVYKKLGFEVEAEYAHFQGSFLTSEINDDRIIPFQSAYLDAVLELDQEVSAEDRKVLLMEDMANAQLYVEEGKVEGVYFPTLKEGLVIARNEKAGIVLMQYRLQSLDFTALPAGNKAAIDFLNHNGFKQFRNSRRMRLGEKRDWKPSGIYSRISGQLG